MWLYDVWIVVQFWSCDLPIYSQQTLNSAADITQKKKIIVCTDVFSLLQFMDIMTGAKKKHRVFLLDLQ